MIYKLVSSSCLSILLIAITTSYDVSVFCEICTDLGFQFVQCTHSPADIYLLRYILDILDILDIYLLSIYVSVFCQICTDL